MVCVAALVASCGGNPTGPGGGGGGGLVRDPVVLVCPPDVRVENVAGTSQAVTFSAPTSTGGVPPLTVTCTPASGAAFSLGDTPVACSATDGSRYAACSFKVTLVARTPLLSVTRFLAFGDSITDGEINDDTGGCVHPSAAALQRDLAGLFSVQRPLSYPADLERLLTERYTTQTFTVMNQGLGADSTSAGVPRFAASVRANAPEAVLLLQGVIDLADSWPSPDGIPGIVRNLDADIAEAQRHGARVFVSTLLPTVPTFRGCYVTSAQIQAANAEIRSLVRRDNAFLVDGYAAFAGRESMLIGPDGLHPTVLGYQTLAETFFAMIKDKLDEVPAATQARRKF